MDGVSSFKVASLFYFSQLHLFSFLTYQSPIVLTNVTPRSVRTIEEDFDIEILDESGERVKSVDKCKKVVVVFTDLRQMLQISEVDPYFLLDKQPCMSKKHMSVLTMEAGKYLYVSIL